MGAIILIVIPKQHISSSQDLKFYFLLFKEIESYANEAEDPWSLKSSEFFLAEIFRKFSTFFFVLNSGIFLPIVLLVCCCIGFNFRRIKESVVMSLC